MGRPEKPVNNAGGLVAQFAGELRALRARAGNPTYREMARSAMFSSSVLSSAASGNRMPSLSVTLAFVAACGGDQDGWRQRWLAVTGGHMRFPTRERVTGKLPYPAQLPQRPRGFIGRVAELAWLRAAGDTPIVISGPAGVGKTGLALYYAYTRAADMTNGQLYADLGAGPSPYDVLDGFLRALGVPGDQLAGTPDHRVGLYRTLLVERRLLVLLDNVLDERQVRPLLVETDTSTTVLVSRKRLLGLREVRRLPVTPLSRADSVEMIVAGLPPTVTAGPDDLDRLAEFCGDLPLALDIALRRIALRPHVILGQMLDGWHRNGNALNWLSIGDLSMREALRSAYLTLSHPARMLLHWLARTADRVGPLPSEEDELADELIDAGILSQAGHDFAGLRLSPLVRAFVRDMACSFARDVPVGAGSPRAGY
ncbi:helix-turn-helix domain-containing protein [Actinokineospora terrae]|uniref:Helix-turn-helix domain-containing protein n=1 Tax=Actinokineospora terrae TaxID=155974 RepID=A0A1H9X4J9_9PSEU|nr:helix-turn-helix domain-containing protein [Actinokineospora terrae]SES40543.1 Helix-turn-helix domain-containing protein [Actinokineospora terrae]